MSDFTIRRKAHMESLDLLMRKKGVMNYNGRKLSAYVEKHGPKRGMKLYSEHLGDLAFAIGGVRYWEDRATKDLRLSREDIANALLFAEGEQE